MRMSSVALIAVVVGSGTACAGRPQMFEGAYGRGFEDHSFRPCGAQPQDRSWWVVMGGPVDSVAKAAVDSAHGQPMFARVRGRVGPEGAYGHLGLSSRILTVVGVEEMRPRQMGDCEGGRLDQGVRIR